MKPALLLAAAATALAAIQLVAYQADPGALWRDIQHDRNTHLAFASDLAVLARTGDPLGWLVRVSQSVIWPPLYGILLSAVLLVTGAGHQVAIIPSLAGWVATIVLCGALAGRLAGPRPETRWTAIAIAGLFALTSPALRLLGADVMLETTGAALSALALLCWMRCAENPDRVTRWRALAVTLTLLFFLKYNYWSLVVAALTLANLPPVIRFALSTTRAARRVPLGRWGWLRLGLPSVLALGLALVGQIPLNLFGHAIVLYPTGLVLTAAYGAALLQVALWWRRARWTLVPAMGPPALTLLRWHVLPVAFWLLVPFALPSTIWFLGGNVGTNASYALTQNLAFQWAGFRDGFHPAAWAALLASALAAIGTSQRRPGATTLVVFLGLCALAVVMHPQQQWRFQATWLFSLWALAGAGAARLLAPAPGAIWRSAIVVLLGAALALQPTSEIAERAAIRTSDGPSDLRLSQAYAPFVADGQPTGFVSTFGKNDFVVWTTRERCRCMAIIDQPFTFADQSRAAVAATTTQWLATTPSRRLIALDAPPQSENAALGLTEQQQRGQLDALTAQTRFRQTETIHLSDHATITVWNDPAPPSPPPSPRHLALTATLLLATAILAILLAPVGRKNASAFRQSHEP